LSVLRSGQPRGLGGGKTETEQLETRLPINEANQALCHARIASICLCFSICILFLGRCVLLGCVKDLEE
jgi:hypothetical protein